MADARATILLLPAQAPSGPTAAEDVLQLGVAQWTRAEWKVGEGDAYAVVAHQGLACHRCEVRTNNLLDLIHRRDDRRADLLALVRSQGRQQAMRFRRPAADPDGQVIRARIVQEALSGDLHRNSLPPGVSFVYRRITRDGASSDVGAAETAIAVRDLSLRQP